MSVLRAPEQARRDGEIRVDAGALSSIYRHANRVEQNCRRLVLRRLASGIAGRLTLVDGDDSYALGPDSADLRATIRVHDPRFYRMAVCGGGLAAAEAYIRRYWDSDDLVTSMRILARQAETMQSMEHGVVRLLNPFRTARNWLRRNSRAGSRRNIAAHYDLSNEFFALMLDPTMTYSSGMFASPSSTLEEASCAKYDRICRKLGLTPDHQVLEVGCGWGGFAIHAAREYGCQITATTISQEQFTFAESRIRALGLSDQISLVQRDYRDLTGQYDRLVSIEMIEAVGEKFLDTYFAKCSGLLKPDGMMVLQAITIPDYRYDSYRRSVDFIQQYIFPGGFLPSFSAIGQSLRRVTDMRPIHLEDFGFDYAQTLARWRENFWTQIQQVQGLGFDDQFIRTWNYYLCYCEAGFRECQIGVQQLSLGKPLSRRSIR